MALLASLLSVAIIAAPAAEAAEPLPWEVEGSAWTGTISTEIFRDYYYEGNFDSRLVFNEEGTYTELVAMDATSNGSYSGHIKGSGTRQQYNEDCGRTTLRKTSDHTWAEDKDNMGHPQRPEFFRITTDAEGRTTLIPRLVDARYTATNCLCDGSETSDSGEYTVLGFQSGESGFAGTPPPVPDEDPDPLHLVGTRTWTLKDPPYGLDRNVIGYSFKITYDLRLCADCGPEPTDSCDDPGVERKFSTLEGTGDIVLAGAPNQLLGNVSLLVPWCITDAGARIGHPLNGYAFLTTNWVLLGALESLGFLFKDPAPPEVIAGTRIAGISAEYALDLDAVAVIANVVPVGKMLKPVAKKLEKLLKAIEKKFPSVKAEREAIRRFQEDSYRLIRKMKNALFDLVEKKLSRVPGTGKLLKVVRKAITGAIKHFERNAVERWNKKIKPEEVRDWLEDIFQVAFDAIEIPVWTASANFVVEDSGEAYAADNSGQHNIFTVSSR